MGKNQHVVSTPDGKWGVRGEKNQKITKILDTQGDAIEFAKRIAKNQKSEVVIHRKNGRIRDKDSCGNDPANIIDKKY